MKVRLSQSGFTLIELLIVIGLVAVLSTVVIITLNPAEIFRQTRDATRLVQLAELSKAVSIFQALKSNTGLGTSSIIYVSIPDPNATSTNGTDCNGLGLPPLQENWEYHCAHPLNFRKTDGSGWVPINFQSATPSPLSILPVDPRNETPGLYFSYISGGSYAITSGFESQKYLKQTATKDGGNDFTRFEAGNDLILWSKALGIEGYWKLDDQNGQAPIDSSGNNNLGSGF